MCDDQKDNIIVARAFTHEHQLSLIMEVAAKMVEDQFRLVRRLALIERRRWRRGKETDGMRGETKADHRFDHCSFPSRLFRKRGTLRETAKVGKNALSSHQDGV